MALDLKTHIGEMICKHRKHTPREIIWEIGKATRSKYSRGKFLIISEDRALIIAKIHPIEVPAHLPKFHQFFKAIYGPSPF